MEASLWAYPRGAIVDYEAPFMKDVCVKYGVLPSHPVMILNAITSQPNRCYQCMMLTSKVDSYYGYRIFLNSANPKKRKYSVIKCTHIFSIEAKYFKEIIGFAPPQLVDKCVQAYAYEIGLTDQIPDYYKNDPTVMGWLEAGEANIPVKPEPFLIKDMDVGAIRDIKVATSYRPKNTTLDAPGGGISVKASRPVDDAYAFIQGDAENPSGMTKMGTTTFVTNDEPVENTESESAEPVTPPSEPEKPDEEAPASGECVNLSSEKEDAPAKSEVKRPHYRKCDVMSEELRDFIEHREYTYTKRNAAIDKAFPLLTSADRYNIWMGRLSANELVKRGIASSQYNAKKLIEYVNFNTHTQKDKLIEGVLNRTINLKFLGTAFIPAFLVMTMGEIHDIKMGLTTYETYAKMFGFEMSQTYVGELRDAGLL